MRDESHAAALKFFAAHNQRKCADATGLQKPKSIVLDIGPCRRLRGYGEPEEEVNGVKMAMMMLAMSY